jgi:hypothetical protein
MAWPVLACSGYGHMPLCVTQELVELVANASTAAAVNA